MQLLLGKRPGKRSWAVVGGTVATLAFSSVLAACGGASSNSNGIVTPVVTSILVLPTNASVPVGSTIQFSATADYNDGSSKNVTSSATWTATNNSGEASIESTGQANPGLATGVSPGDVNVTVSFSGVNAVTILNVTGSGTLTSFSLSQVDPHIAPSTKLQMFGYAEYSGGSATWVTSSTHWTSSNPSVATVQDKGGASPGLVTAVASSGTTTITGTFNGLQQSTTVTIAANAKPIDVMDMKSTDSYLGYQGGLYENSSDTVPSVHDTSGLAAAAAIHPLDQNGNQSVNGAVVFLGIGMSNATEEFSAFASTAAGDGGVNHTTLAIEDGASGAATACYWTVAQGQTTVCPNAKGPLLDNQYDRVRDTVLATATGAPSAPAGCGTTSNPCLTEKQVQVLWIKNANPRPGPAGTPSLCGCAGDSASEAILYESQMGQMIRAAKSRYPNLKQVFLATRIYAGYATDGLNPEPYAYEYGYSAKWLIEAQVQQERGNAADPVAGDMSLTTAAWTAWGTYIWADGATPRSDGLDWVQNDFQSDGTHPGPSGTTKVVDQLMGFFKGSTYTPWFRP